MKTKIFFYFRFPLICILILSFLSGCRVVLHENNPLKEEEVKGNRLVTLTAQSITSKTTIIIRGQSNLPQSTILQVDLKPYDNKANQSKVINNKVQPETIPVVTEQIKTDKNGNFLLIIPRGDGTRRHRLEVIFKPNLQPKKILKIYGPLGENIGKSTGLKTFTEGSQSMKGLFLSTHILKIDEGATLDSRRELNASGKFTADIR
jgi:hypothetical protein